MGWRMVGGGEKSDGKGVCVGERADGIVST